MNLKDKADAADAIPLDDSRKAVLLTPKEVRWLLDKLLDLETRVSVLEKP